MTQAINFFQTLFPFKTTAAPVSGTGGGGTAEFKLAAELKKEARKLAAAAEQELTNGRKSQVLVFAGEDKAKVMPLAEIAVWHTGRAAAAYRQAARCFAEAGCLQTEKRRAFNLMIKEMTLRAVEAETALHTLNSFLTRS